MSSNPIGPTGPKPDLPPNLSPEDKVAWNLPSSKLSPDDPWVTQFSKLFPNVNQAEVQHFAAVFKNNMFNWLNDQIKKDQARAKEASDKLKKALTGEE